MAQTQAVGIQSPRVEGEAKVTGKAVYAADVTVPHMLFAKVLRSPLPHARIQRIYEELQAVFDPLEAMSSTAPLLHPEVANYAGLVHKLDQASNVVVHLNWRLRDVEAAFQQSDLVVENTFKTPIVHQAYIEPRSCIVAAKTDGDAEVWACTKSPANLRELVAGNPRHSAVVRVKTGVRKPGYIVAQHIDLVFDSGAYSALRPQGILVGAQSATGPYRVPNALIEERYVL